MLTIHEPAREIPVITEADICVLGGSCTGVFAAVRAARMGARVVIVEKQGRFGGVATNSLVNVWHSLYDTEGNRQIISGLTEETMNRLDRRAAVTRIENNPSTAFIFNSEELAIELDELVTDAGVIPYLHTAFCQPVMEDGRVTAAIIENKAGRGAIRAQVFIDATGDGDLCHRAGFETYTADVLQPPTTCARFCGWDSIASELREMVREHGAEYDLPPGFIWGANVPGSDVHMMAGTRIQHTDCSDADALTAAEMEGRRQVRAVMDMARKYLPGNTLTLQALPSLIGIRHTRQVRCLHQLSDRELLYGVQFDDAVANGSYRVDVHHQDDPGVTFKYLDGTQSFVSYDGTRDTTGRWREETEENPTYYQIPFRCLVPQKSRNVLLAGRMLDAETEAFAAVRVMVNLNQTGEAVGVAAALSVSQAGDISGIDAGTVRNTLENGGSAIF